ncbi:MAG: hypothetical protein EOO92_18995, partial [Pedobacter sp.]
LQCLSNVPPLTEYFVSGAFKRDLNRTGGKCRGNLATEYAALLSKMWRATSGAAHPGRVKSVIGAAESRFMGCEQQDAQEFLQIVTERLGDEYHAGKKVRGQARKKHAVAANDASQLSLDHTKTPDELDRSEETINKRTTWHQQQQLK